MPAISRKCWPRYHQNDVASRNLAEIGGRLNGRIERDARQERGVFVPVVDAGDRLRLVCPDQHVPPRPAGNRCKRGTPSAGADDANGLIRLAVLCIVLLRHAPSPWGPYRRFSARLPSHALTPAPAAGGASGSSGHRARAGVSSPSTRPLASRSAPAQAIIAALSVQRPTGGATSRKPRRSAVSSSAPGGADLRRRRPRPQESVGRHRPAGSGRRPWRVPCGR